MTVLVDGIEKYHWPVSSGRAGYSTPSGTYTATSMNEIWYSKQWGNSPMPHSIFFMRDGHAVHGSYEVKNLGKPVSHGCVRISPENATALYALVEENRALACFLNLGPRRLNRVTNVLPAARSWS
jgi:lipoprotein-anchoring transpeptidase ErfK/SrfK